MKAVIGGFDKIMNSANHSAKIINLTPKIGCKRSGTRENKNGPCQSEPRVIAITSGKGGVGKTNIVANLGLAFSRLGKKVLILDADMGLGNLDVLLGLAPKYNLSHVIKGEKTIHDIVLTGPEDLKILPASSGIQELTNLTVEQKIRVLTQLDVLVDSVDILLIDTAAGISSNVMDFNVTAHEIMVVVSPEPTALTDAYALMKVLSLKYSIEHCKLLVNLVVNNQEGKEIYRQLNLVASRFLEISIEYVGCVLFDEKVTQGVRKQKNISELYPNTGTSRCFIALAKKILKTPILKLPQGGSNFFWDHLSMNQLA
jgi:flagellar biosynthesis protein FlhG